MKKMLLLALALSATSAFAQRVSNYCEADMIDQRGRTIETIRAFDCQEAMKQCRIRINDLRMRGVYDCKRYEDNTPIPNPNPYPNPNPNPYPNPNPNPYPGPQTGYDARRLINNGESVILQNRIFTVVGVSFQGLYAVRANDAWNTITNNVRRESLAVMNGCNLGVCTSKSVIDIQTSTFVKVIGLSYDDRFVTQANDVWNTINSNIDRSRLAMTEGCISSRYAQLCVGNQVITQQNRYATVAGIQLDGRVVLRQADVWNTLTPNVNPETLVITR